MQIAGIAALEAAVLAIVALAVAVPLSVGGADVRRKSRLLPELHAGVRPARADVAQPVQFGLIAVGVTMLAQVLPSIGAAPHHRRTNRAGAHGPQTMVAAPGSTCYC